MAHHQYIASLRLFVWAAQAAQIKALSGTRQPKSRSKKRILPNSIGRRYSKKGRSHQSTKHTALFCCLTIVDGGGNDYDETLGSKE